jgi:hypothetical protein
VTASPSGLVRTVRAPSRINALRIGQRLSVRARPFADGTFASQEIRILGRAKQARVRAVVVKYQRALKRYSAGGSVFALRTGSARSLASSAEEPPPAQPGTEIVATVNVSGGTAQAQQVGQVGRVGKLELEGILLELSASSLRLVVARAGYVNVTIPDQQLATLFYIVGLGFTRDPHITSASATSGSTSATSSFTSPRARRRCSEATLGSWCEIWRRSSSG